MQYFIPLYQINKHVKWNPWKPEDLIRVLLFLFISNAKHILGLLEFNQKEQNKLVIFLRPKVAFYFFTLWTYHSALSPPYLAWYFIYDTHSVNTLLTKSRKGSQWSILFGKKNKQTETVLKAFI